MEFPASYKSPGSNSWMWISLRNLLAHRTPGNLLGTFFTKLALGWSPASSQELGLQFCPTFSGLWRSNRTRKQPDNDAGEGKTQDGKHSSSLFLLLQTLFWNSSRQLSGNPGISTINQIIATLSKAGEKTLQVTGKEEGWEGSHLSLCFLDIWISRWREANQLFLPVAYSKEKVRAT